MCYIYYQINLTLLQNISKESQLPTDYIYYQINLTLLQNISNESQLPTEKRTKSSSAAQLEGLLKFQEYGRKDYTVEPNTFSSKMY